MTPSGIAASACDDIIVGAGTCRMGTDARAVLDPALRVRGVGKLRVVDNSIMPTLLSADTAAPALMIGERAADFSLADAR